MLAMNEHLLHFIWQYTHFDKMGVKAKNAVESQGLIQLKTSYCDAKKCLNCNLGNKLLA